MTTDSKQRYFHPPYKEYKIKKQILTLCVLIQGNMVHHAKAGIRTGEAAWKS